MRGLHYGRFLHGDKRGKVFLYPDGLAPGDQPAFEATSYSWEPTCFSTVSLGASGQ